MIVIPEQPDNRPRPYTTLPWFSRSIFDDDDFGENNNNPGGRVDIVPKLDAVVNDDDRLQPSRYFDKLHHLEQAEGEPVIIFEPGLLSEEKFGPLVVVVLLILTGLVVFLIKCYCDAEIDSDQPSSSSGSANSRSRNNQPHHRYRQRPSGASAGIPSNNSNDGAPPPSYEEAVNMPRVSDILAAKPELLSSSTGVVLSSSNSPTNQNQHHHQLYI